MVLFPTQHALTQGSLHYRLATLGYQKRNTYGVETFFLYHDLHFFVPIFMADCTEKVQRLWRRRIKFIIQSASFYAINCVIS